MVAVPRAPAVTKPVDEPMAAIPALLLLHTPPGGVAVSVSVPPGHNDVGGVNVGSGCNTTNAVAVSDKPDTVFITW